MTIASNDRRKEYPGNGATTVFTGPRAYSASHVYVYSVVNATGVATRLTSGFTITGLGATNTTVTLDAATAAAMTNLKTLLILRVVPYEQDTDITNQGSYLPEVLEDAIDKLSQQIQQLAEMADRALRVSDTSTGVSPVDTTTAGRYVVTSLNPNGFTVTDVPPFADATLRTDLANLVLTTKGTNLVGFLSDAAGAVGRTVRSRLNEVISVKDFGAVGDGVSDDTVAINLALTAGTSKTVLFPPGTYKTSATLVIWSNTVILGYGANIVPIDAGTFPIYQALDDAVDLVGGAALGSKPILSNQDPAAGNSNITIMGLKWTGNVTGSPSMHGLHMNKITGLQILGCHTYECLSAIAVLNSTDLKILGNTVKGFRNGGIDTWAGCKRVVIANNHVDGVAPNSDGSNIGIFCTSEPTDGAVDANTYNADDYLIAHNLITNIENAGIWVGGGDPTHNRVNDIARRVHVVGNIIIEADGMGIILERSEDCVIEGNTIVRSGNHGIFTRKNITAGTAYCDRPIIRNNDFRTVGVVTADSKFIHMDDTTRDAMVYGNRGTGTGHTYGMYDRATNSGLMHYGNRFAAGSSGVLTILSVDDISVPDDYLVKIRGATTGGVAITLFDAAVQGAVWEVILRTASAGAVAAAYARFMVYGNTTLPSIVARETAGAVTYTLALSGTNVQATSNIATTTSVYTATRKA